MWVRNLMRRWRLLPAILAVGSAVLATAVTSVTARSLSSLGPAEVAKASAAIGAHGVSASGATGGASIAAASGAGPMLGGFTAQGWPAVVQLSKDKRRLTVAEVGLLMTCTSGAELALDPYVMRVPVARNGRFHVSGTIPATSGNPVSITGGSESFSGSLNRLRSTLSGTWQLHLDFQATDGSSDHCDSGPVKLAARL